ncbi:hypothetical protein ID741_003908 [Enterococcus sp. AZ103]
MFFSIFYTFIFGLVFFGIMHFINLKKGVSFSKFQFFSGCINLFISLTFLFIYFRSSDLFDTFIDNSIISLIFTIMVSYFYIFLAPISLGNMIFLVKSKPKNKYVILFLNLASCVITTLLIPLFLKWYN